MSIFDTTTIRIKSFFRKLWQQLEPKSKYTVGSQRPYNSYNYKDDTLWGRNFDYEIKEIVIRDPDKGIPLVEMFENCVEFSTPVYQIVNAMRSSVDGDDQGFAIAKTLNDKSTKIDPQVKYLLDRLIEERIGSARLEWAMNRFIAYGDAFASVVIDLSKQRILRLLPVPTWQMFRVESNFGELQCFEQRHQLTEVLDDDSTYGTIFHPGQIVHWRFRRYSVYGRSLFYQATDDWIGLKCALNALKNALIEVGINPNIHVMPCDVPEGYAEAYKEALRAERMMCGKPVADYFMPAGGDVKKVSTKDPDLKAILQVLRFHQQRLIMASNTPPWMLAWEMSGGREISQGPALAYSRFINGCRQAFADGLRHLCNIELALNGFSQEQWQYRIIWPKIYVNPFEEQNNPMADEINHPSIDNLED